MSTEHKRPMLAFVAVVIICGVVVAHAARGNAAESLLKRLTRPIAVAAGPVFAHVTAPHAPLAAEPVPAEVPSPVSKVPGTNLTHKAKHRPGASRSSDNAHRPARRADFHKTSQPSRSTRHHSGADSHRSGSVRHHHTWQGRHDDEGSEGGDDRGWGHDRHDGPSGHHGHHGRHLGHGHHAHGHHAHGRSHRHGGDRSEHGRRSHR